MIRAKELIKIYPGPIGYPEKTTVALNSVSVTIEKGEIVAIVGESGAGKTTFLKVILGLLKPDSGIVIINNQSLYGLSRNKRKNFRLNHFYFIKQDLNENLISNLNGMENIELELIAMNKTTKNIKNIINDLIKGISLNLDYLIPVSKLSGGEKQFLCFIKAMVQLPDIIIIDEPTTYLDSKLKHELMKIIVNIVKSFDITLIYTTHDPDIASYAEKIVGISAGKFDRILKKQIDKNNIPPNEIENLILGKFTEIPISPSGTIHLPVSLLKILNL